MANLKSLRTRIRSIKSTQKITKAMQLVSAAKLTKMKNQITDSNAYIEVVKEMMSVVLENKEAYDLSLGEQNFFLQEVNIHKRLYLLIVITSERGLCGGFNQGVMQQVKIDIDELVAKQEGVKLVIVGKKGLEHLSKQYADYIDSYFELPKNYDHNFVSRLKEKIMMEVTDLGVSNCILYFNKFKNTITQIATKQQILPIEKRDDIGKEHVFEYEGVNLVKHLINAYINSRVSYALLQNMVSEEGARMVAMENATNNAHGIVDKLTLKLNRSRQDMITTELTEIIAGTIGMT